MSPITGIFETKVFRVLAGTKVPLKLKISFLLSKYPSIKIEIEGPIRKISFISIQPFLVSYWMDNLSKLIPSPFNASVKPFKSARLSNFAKPGAWLILKFSISKFPNDFSLLELER